MKHYPHMILALLALLANPLAAHAYIDPGAGSLLLQLLLGGVAGAFVFFRLFKQKLFSLLGLGKDDQKSDE
ncbi:MAG: hypothetical protein O7A06_05480 [Acidobacteria bacterium]|nr:hypothetical protein [Acidobacteriota bacterium]MCZ6750986.1 hypothetical protein [Acidobacteriota bacterium]